MYLRDKKINILGENTLYYFTIAILFVFLKFIFKIADNNSLRFLLAPTNWLVELVTNSKSIYISESGYINQQLGIVINKSCAGINFCLLCFVALSFISLNFPTNTKKIFALFVSVLLAYILTILVNTSRILVSITSGNLLGEHKPHWLHQTEGAFIYLLSLVIIYVCSDFLMKKYLHEKLN